LIVNRSPVAPQAVPQDGAFEIFLAWSETTLTVGPGQTVLQVLVDAGIPVEPGCQTGGCGMCVMDYVEGDVVHKDGCLDRAERTHRFCPCVSRARTRIVLAL
jgi:ferredoxin